MPNIHARSRQAGWTLPELLIGIVLMGIFGLTLLAFYQSSITPTTATQNQTTAQLEGRNAIDRLTRELRQAVSPDAGLTPPVQSMNTTSIVFHYDGDRNVNDLTPAPQRIRYTISGTDLTREAANPTGPNTWAPYGPPEVIAQGVANGAVPLFAGRNLDGVALAASIVPPQTASLAQITIRLLLGYKTGQANSTLELTTDVVPRNPRTS